MKVNIKDFAINMEVKNNGIEFEVRNNAGKQLGDCFVTKTGLTWCAGKTDKKNGVAVTWDEFIEWMKNKN